MVPRVVLNRLETTTLAYPQHTGTEPSQRETNGRERATASANTRATTSTQRGTKQPRRNIAPQGDKKNWTLEPTQAILIIGDSNLCKIPTYTQENLQIECYPGMRFNHAADLLRNTNRNEKVSHCIISVGIFGPTTSPVHTVYLAKVAIAKLSQKTIFKKYQQVAKI